MRTHLSSRWAILVACTLALSAGTAGAAPTPNTPYASAEQARQALEVLKSNAAPGEKAVACKRLAIYGGAEAVPVLATFLNNKDLASWARIPLEVIPGPAADNALREALGRLQGNLLIGVINSIGVRGDAKAVDPLVVLLKDPDAEVASAAAAALGKIGGSPASSALEAALATAPAGVRSTVAEGLVVCAERLSAGGPSAEAVRLYDLVRRADVPRQRRLEAIRGAILARGAEGLPLLLEALRAPDAATFGLAVRTSRELGGRAVTEALAAELAKVPAERQTALLLALTDRRDDAVWPAVNGAAKQGGKSLRLVAIAALERKGDASALPALLEAATASDGEVAKAAKGAASRLPGKDIDAAIANALPKAGGASRQVLVELAGQRKIAAAVPNLFQAAGESDADLRGAAIEALGATVGAGEQLGQLADLLAKASNEEGVEAVESALDAACTRLTDKAACAAPLLARLEKSGAPARCALLRVLGTVGTADALGAVRTSLKADDKTVRDAAFRVLADWPEAGALPALTDVIRNPADDTQRTLALRGAVRLLGAGDVPASTALKAYAELLGLARRVDDRKLVLSGIGAIPDPAAAKMVEPLLAEANIRKEAESALLSIAGGLAGSSPAEATALAKRLQAESQDAAIRERAGQVLQRMDKFEDYITAWQFAGGYKLASGESGSLFAKEFAPEKGDEKVAWRPLAAGTQAAKPWMLDLLATKAGDAGCAGYARTWVYSEKAQPARVEFGTDDGHKLWLNGERIAQADRGGAAVPGEFKTTVSLREGWNLFLLKVTQDSGPWEFCFRVRTPGGGKLSGLKVQALPPEK